MSQPRFGPHPSFQQMYDLGRKKLLRKCENKQMPSMVLSLTVTGDRVFAGDQMESCHCFKYRRAENQLVEFADDQVNTLLIRVCVVVFALSRLRYRVCVIAFALSCSRFRVCVIVFALSCLRYRVCVIVFASSCLRYRVCVIVFALSCLPYRVCYDKGSTFWPKRF